MLATAPFFILGAIIGSFLNVVILRYGSGRSVNGRSFCFSCSKTLQWYELIPLFSFLFLRGRCRSCGARISWQYFLVEALTAIVFVLLYFKFLPVSFPDFFLFSYYAIAFSILIVILGYDLRHKIIPDGLSFSFSALSLAKVLFDIYTTGFSWGPLLAGPLLALPFVLLWFFSRGRWMGLGDGKLALGMGWFLGLTEGFSAVLFAFWIGAAVALGVMGLERLFTKKKQLTMKSEIPFGPFLILGLAIVFFCEFSLFTYLLQ